MITRPKGKNSELAHSLKATGNLAISAPLIRIEHLELVPRDLKQFLDWSDIVIFTSQNTILPTINKINDIRIFDEKNFLPLEKKLVSVL